MRSFGPLLVLASLLVPARASADETRWYGWQTLAVDAIGIGLIATGALAADDETRPPLIVAGMSSYLLAGPAVHALHGSVDKAGGSLLLRSAATAAGGLVGFVAWAYSCDGTFLTKCSPSSFVAPVLVSAGIGAVLDAVFLGTERRASTSRISAGVAPSRGGFTAGLSGSF